MAFFFSYFFLSSFPHYSGMLGPDLCSFLIRVELIVYDLICLAFENIPAFSAQRNENV